MLEKETIVVAAAALLVLLAGAVVSPTRADPGAVPTRGSAAEAPQPPRADVIVEEERTVMKSGPGRRPFDVTRHTIPLEEIVGGGPPVDAIPALGLTGILPRFVPPSDAGWLADDELVIGVRIGDVAKAYPIEILNWHEVVNDTFSLSTGSSVPVVVAYCPLCGSATVSSRRVIVDGDPKILKFGVSGKLYNSNLLMYDRQTYSLWSQFTGSAVTGPLAGTPFELLPSDSLAVPTTEQEVRHTTWASWRERHPDTSVLARDGQRFPQGLEGERDYEQDPYGQVPRRVGRRVVGTYDYHREGTPLMFEPEARPDDAPIGDKARVVGIWFGGDRYKAYPLEALQAAGGEVTETIGDKTVTVKLENPHSAYAVTPDGRPVRVVHTYWFAWYAFHPDTELFWPEGERP